MAALSGEWYNALKDEFSKPYYSDLYHFVRDAYQKERVYPPYSLLFRAFEETPLDKVRVVILGQDPYHEAGQANGLCFSVSNGQPLPPSLVNIYKELHDDLGVPIATSGDLGKWAAQGVLLLNTVLTVREHAAASHRGKGWEQLTDAAIRAVADKNTPVVFILWGRAASEKKSFIYRPDHLVISSPHPSPLSAHRGFFGSKPFSKTNAFLHEHGLAPIDWEIG